MPETYTTSLTGEHKNFLQQTFKDVAFDPESLRVYASDASLHKGTPLAMVQPRNTEEVSKLLRWADAERIAIHPRGRGTGLSGGCVPNVPGIVVSMLGMDKILNISEEDFVAEVEPGVNTGVFQTECEKHGVFFPPDPASGKATSIGGNLMNCAGGLRAVKYGVMRDYVLGVEVVVPGGKVLRFGGRSHKDVVGLDMARLFVGSEGTLGIVTKIILKLIPKPKDSASVLVGYPSLEDARLSMGRVFAAGILPCAIEFMNETVLEVLEKTGSVPWPDSVKALLLFQVDGNSDTVPLDIARLSNQLDESFWRMQGVGKTEEDKIWSYRRKVGAAGYELGPDRYCGDMAIPRGSLFAALDKFKEIAEAHGKKMLAFGHAGDGNVHATIHYDATDAEDAKQASQAHDELDDAVIYFGGSLSGEHGCGFLKDVSKQIGPDELEMMQSLRKLFDPNGILNPGKGY